MSDPSTYWLNFMNIALGVIVLICCAAVAVGVVQELAASARRPRPCPAWTTKCPTWWLPTAGTHSTSRLGSPWPMAARNGYEGRRRAIAS